MNIHAFALNHDDGSCRQCGLGPAAHGTLPDHPEEAKLRGQEIDAATSLNLLAGKAAKALRGHNRIEAVVLLSQLELMSDILRLAMRKAVQDQMDEMRSDADLQP